VGALPAEAIGLAGLSEYGRPDPAATVAVKAGLWPAVESSRRSGDAVVASAITHPSVTANGYLIAYLPVLYRKKRARPFGARWRSQRGPKALRAQDSAR
jgi:hypothetical protein